MIHNCTTCYYWLVCSDWKQCADYREATQKEMKEILKSNKDAEQSSTNIHDYDEQDAITRELLRKAQEKGL